MGSNIRQKLFYARTSSENSNVVHMKHHWCYHNLVCRNNSPNVYGVHMSPEIKTLIYAVKREKPKTSFEEPPAMCIQYYFALRIELNHL